MNWYKLASFNEDLLRSFIRDLGEEKGKQLAEDVDGEIKAIGIPYRFEAISALGIAKHDVCIISKYALGYNVSNIMFVLFHELAHYYQYRKYGNDFAMAVYMGDESEIDKGVEKLKQIESTADKFSRLKSSYYINKYKIDKPVTMSGYGGKFIDASLKSYLVKIRGVIKEMKYTTITEINEYLYNMIKYKTSKVL